MLRPTAAFQTRAEIVALYQRVWQHSDATIEALPLDATGRVPWWGEDNEVTLHRILVHVTAETQRHAGHADVVRELADGLIGTKGVETGRLVLAAAEPIPDREHGHDHDHGHSHDHPHPHDHGHSHAPE